MLTHQEEKDIKKLIKKALCCIDNDMYLFQVRVPDSGHIHYAALSKEEAQELIHETRNNVPVADPSQPSVTITTESNGNPGDEHIHDLTIYFDYDNHTFIVTDISNNLLYNHEAFLVGGGLRNNNGLRSDGSFTQLGSDSISDAKGSELLQDTFVHLDGNNLTFVGGSNFTFSIDSTTALNHVSPDFDGEDESKYLWKVQALADKTISFNFSTSTTNIPATNINNDVFMMGWNLAGGGGSEVLGKTAIGLSFENNYEPSAGDDLAEHHTFFIDKTGTQHRLQSYTIDKDNPANWNVYQTLRKSSLVDPVNGNQYFINETDGVSTAFKFLNPSSVSQTGAEIYSDPSQKYLKIAPVNYATGSDIWQNTIDLRGWGILNTSQFEAIKYSSLVQFTFKSDLPVYADNAAAILGGLPVRTIYRTSTGDLKIVY